MVTLASFPANVTVYGLLFGPVFSRSSMSFLDVVDVVLVLRSLFGTSSLLLILLLLTRSDENEKCCPGSVLLLLF